MLNIISIIIGLIALVIVIPSQIPLLGWGNWLALPVVVIGIGIGALSGKNHGRNLCLVVFAVAVVRLLLGEGII